MATFDGLKKINSDKIYRPNTRLNFLVSDSLENETPRDQRENPRGNFDRDNSSLNRPSNQKYTGLKIGLIIALIVLITGAMYLSEKIFTPGSGMAEFKKFNPFARLAYLITSSDKKLAGEFSDRVNILLLGVGGQGHDGPYLTDTIILLSLKPSTGEIGMVSLPRDMVTKYKDGGWYKINQIYSMGRQATNENEKASPEQGIAALTQTLKTNFKFSTDYYALITFDAFQKFIDEIGGIAVNVPNSFYDPLFPTDDYLTKQVTFEEGLQTMDGEHALTYARSRHGSNNEGSDFARSKRQQLIIRAIKDHLVKFSTLLSPSKLSAIFDLLEDGVETNISVWQGIKIFNLAQRTGEDKIYSITVDDGPDGFLIGGYDNEGAYILQPKDGNYEVLARQINNIFNTGIIKSEKALIEVHNGTAKPGLAYWTKLSLEKLGYVIVGYQNADKQDYQKTLIYDLTSKDKKHTLKWLKEELNGEVIKQISDEQKNSEADRAPAENQADILVILGQDYAYNFKIPEEKPIQTSTSTAVDLTSTSTRIMENNNQDNE